MKLLSVSLARSIWLGPMIDYNPRGLRLDSILHQFLIDTYKFRKIPALIDPVKPGDGRKYQEGEFEVYGNLIIVDFVIYTDGVVVDSRSSTVHNELFLEDVFKGFSKYIKLPTPDEVIKEKLYLSQVYVTTDKNLEIINPKVKQISKYLNNHVTDATDVQLGGLSFWSDQAIKRPPTPFTFERTLNTPFSDNRYYSAAPLQTDEHLELLDKLESIL